MRLADFQRSQAENRPKGYKWGIVYDTGHMVFHEDQPHIEVELLSLSEAGLLFYTTEAQAVTVASWFRKDAFINLRVVNIKKLLKGKL